MNKELKISITLLFVLILLPVGLLYSLAGIHPFSKPFYSGFLPFLFLLVPYILFSASQVTRFFQEKITDSFWMKLTPPLYLLALYSILQFLYSSFQWNFFLIFFLWLAIPTLLFCIPSPKNEQVPSREFITALLLWLPIEYGFVREFDLRFSEQTQIPALPLATPLFGLYLFLILRKLSGIGYTFLWKWKDIAVAGVALLSLAVILIPLGTASGFIRLSLREASTPEILQLIFGIYFFVALPEELFFRGIIQNLLSKAIQTKTHFTIPSPPPSPTKGEGNIGESSPLRREDRGEGDIISLLLASIIFGLAHLNNPPVPNWPYAFLSTIAGIFYGLTYMKTGKTTISAIVHCGVNFIWAMLFKDTPG